MKTQNLQTSLTSTPLLGDPKPVSVTNNLTNSGNRSELTTDIVVISAKNNDDDSTGVIYGQDVLTMLPTGSDTYTIAKGSTGTIQLSDPVYNLIHAESKHLYPVKIVAELQDITTEDYPPITVAQADLTQMQLAEKFNQVISAYPDTTMAQDYHDTMTKTYDSANGMGDIEDAVAAFFKRYPDYATLDLNSVTALSTYYKKFPFPWTAYKDSYTFYLYSSDGNTITNQGSLELSVTNPPDPASVTDGNGAFTILYKSSSGETMNMQYNKGQFVSSIDAPVVCLQGLYVAKSTLTKVSTDNFMVPVLTGTVNGTEVIGSDTQQSTGDDDSGSSSSFWQPKDLTGWVILFLTLSGIGMSFGWIGSNLKALYDKLKGKKSSIEEIKEKLKAMQENFQASQERLIERLDGRLQIPQDFKSAITKVNDLRNQALVEEQRAVGYNKLNTLENDIKTISKYGVDPTIESLQSDLIKAKQDLGKATTMDEVNAVHNSFDNIKTKTDTVAKDREQKFSKEESKAMEGNEIKLEQFKDNSNLINEEQERSKSGREPEIEEPPIEDIRL